jgi:hypothetical protein
MEIHAVVALTICIIQRPICLLASLQVLLVFSSGSLTKSLPVMALAYFGILRAWSRSVATLATLHVCAFTTHSIDEDSEDDEQIVCASDTWIEDLSPTAGLAA